MNVSVPEFSFGDLRFDWLQVFKGETKLPLTELERRILEYIVIRRPSEMSGSVIAAHLYGRTPSEWDMRSFWTTLYNLRKKLETSKTVVGIETRTTGSAGRKYTASLLVQAAE